MKSPMLFLQALLDDLSSWCGTSTDRDLKTISARFEHEGWSFLTITLANFGADLQKGLDQGYVGSDQFVGFSRTGGLPRFLSGFLCRVFDARSGRLLDDPDVTCIWAVRQLTLAFAKIELPCTKAREKKAIEGYLECEQEIRHADANRDARFLERFKRIGVLLWADYLSAVDRKVYEGEIIPSHGPGKTADRLDGNAKWTQRSWTSRLDRVFPMGESLLPNWGHYQGLDDLDLLEPGAEQPVRVVLVPKTQKTPRVIAMEPTCMQYMQQGLLREFTSGLDHFDQVEKILGWMSREPNRQLAQQSSLSGELATLDLSEASDRVSNQLVRLLLANHPHLQEGVEACRSRKADVPGKGIIRLAKFASMGSALTFPLESMVFATIAFVGIEEALSRPLSRGDINSLIGRVRVYGDDIIVPVDFVHAVVQCLETFGLKVNRSKSFWSGKFRESCGGDYYAGQDVSIVRVRDTFPVHRTDVRQIEKTVSLRNRLYWAGLWRSAALLDEALGERLAIPLPIVESTSAILGRESVLGYQTQKLHRSYHSPLVWGMTKRSVIPSNRIDGLPALMKCLLTNCGLPSTDARHLERSGRPRTVSIKARWAQPF